MCTQRGGAFSTREMSSRQSSSGMSLSQCSAHRSLPRERSNRWASSVTMLRTTSLTWSLSRSSKLRTSSRQHHSLQISRKQLGGWRMHRISVRTKSCSSKLQGRMSSQGISLRVSCSRVGHGEAHNRSIASKLITRIRALLSVIKPWLQPTLS